MSLSILEYDPKFYAIPGIDGPLNLTCQYHIKVAVASWINVGIIAFGVTVYFLFIPIGILVHEAGVRINEAIKNEWIYRKECFEAWKLQKNYREERTHGENIIDNVSRVDGENTGRANGEEKSEIRINIDG
ncbi:5243_t:CDS:1 [Acaulospora morrowiae]|uniref:5243_t:CDS:1 n=1 Tax=Acaulospora morrowiae TaxID=94023 RepID=A0A9N9CYG1_9GLOM|nr:5243_t:CDS:1 [Acaulospora morrowiae]